MTKSLNVVLLITDGHGHHTGDLDWGTEEFRNLRSRLERLELGRRGYTKFNRVMSPAVSTIMSIESILSGLHAAKTHKMHWREWPEWDRLDYPQLSDFLSQRDYTVYGFSYLLNSENWMPGIRCYRPDLYSDFPSHKRDTHSHEAVLAALRHYFEHAFEKGKPQFLMVHSIFLYDMWEDIEALFSQHGLTAENTVIAFTADHYFPKNFGRQWLLGERDRSMIFHHTDLTEYNTRVFLYLKYPGMPAAREIDELVTGYDIAPTILELLGLRDKWPGILDGESLVPLVDGRGRPARFLRADNVYPYQIGEKQGRITAIRSGRYKYIHRPDPVSSYIVYRMHEPWASVIGQEEFYDVESDPEEQHNLIGSAEVPVSAALRECRAYYQRSTEELLAFHSRGLRQHAERLNLGPTLLAGGKGRLLCIQTCPPEVFATLVNVLVDLLPSAEIMVVVHNFGTLSLPARCRVARYPEAQPYEQALLARVLGTEFTAGFDSLLITSSLPVGDYASVYDNLAHPGGEMAAAREAVTGIRTSRRLILSLDMSIRPITAARQSPLKALGGRLRGMAAAPLRLLLVRLKPRLLKWVRSVEGSGPKMSAYFAGRIIRKP